MKKICVYCRTFLIESSQKDPVVCSGCESAMDKKQERLLELI